MYFWTIFIMHTNQLVVRQTDERTDQQALRNGWRYCANIKNDCPWLCYNQDTDGQVDVWEWASDCKLWLTEKMAEGAGKRAQREQNRKEKAIGRAYHSKSKRIRRKHNIF